MPKAESDRKLPIFVHSRLDDYGLSPSEFRLYGHISRRAGNGICRESVPNMAHHCGLGTGTVKRSLRTLIDSGLITRESHTGQTSHYRLTHPDQWRPGPNETQVCGDLPPDHFRPATQVCGDPPPGSFQTHKGTPLKGSLEGNPMKGENTPTPALDVEALKPESPATDRPGPDPTISTLVVQSPRSGQEKNSAPRRRQKPALDQTAWKDAYNALKPDKWARCEVLSKRLKGVERAVQAYSGDEQRALTMFRLSLAFIRICKDPYWRDWDNGEFLTPLRQLRFIPWAEKAVEMNLNPDAISESGLTDSQIKVARLAAVKSPFAKHATKQTSSPSAHHA